MKLPTNGVRATTDGLAGRRVVECRNCGSRFELERGAKACPICEEIIYPHGLGERRSEATVPFIRDWITALRFAGGDFDKTAARAAQEVARAQVKRGIPPTEVFEGARAAYYEALRAPRSQNGDRPSRSSAEAQRDDGSNPSLDGEDVRMAHTA
jgi:hypothetical protein